MTLKAYAIQEEAEGTGGIVFAKHAVVARREGAGLFNGGEFSGLSCRRAAWADVCAETGVVPAARMVAHGWWFECGFCGRRIDEDSLAERGLKVEGVVGTQHSFVYCCRTHATKARLEAAQRRRAEAAAIDLFSERIRRRFPSAALRSGERAAHAYVCGGLGGPWVVEQVVIAFDFPGQKYGPAELRYQRSPGQRVGPFEPEFSCCAGDREAFEVFAAEQKAAAPRRTS